MTEKPSDLPFDECVQKARMVLAQTDGHISIFQKWTCKGCGNRLTLDIANSFYTHGKCDNCPAVTDIRLAGCGYMIIQSSEPQDLQEIGLRPPPADGITIFFAPDKGEEI